MKLPENPTKIVRIIISNILQCPGYRMSEKELYEIKKLCDCLDTVILTMKLHIKELERRWLGAESQNYCKICGKILDGYIPPRIEYVEWLREELKNLD